jgi:hypothetical protein
MTAIPQLPIATDPIAADRDPKNHDQPTVVTLASLIFAACRQGMGPGDGAT